MKLTSVSEVKSLMDRHNISFNKGFGQNFLINDSVPRRIAEECGAKREDGILEIGPGIGAMTAELAERYSKIVAVEIDKGLIPILGETLAGFDNVAVINADILKSPLEKIKNDYFGLKSVTVCANLPYYITSPILMYLLESTVHFENITVMVQKEVARRLCSLPGQPDYGALTASVNRYGKVSKLFDVSAGSFLPAPKVDSSVVRIEIYNEKPYAVFDENILGRTIKGAFAQRRKTLGNSLSTEFGELNKNEINGILASLGYKTGVRGEELSIGEYALIANKIYEIRISKNR